MKKILALMLALVMAVSLASCGGNGETKQDTTAESTEATTEKATEAATELKGYKLGEKFSNDLMDFTLKKACFSYYASSAKNDNTWAKPLEEDITDYFTPEDGYVDVCMTFKIKNIHKDKVIYIGDSKYNKNGMQFELIYNDFIYPINSFDEDDKRGCEYFRLYASAISYDGGKNFEPFESDYYVLSAGQSVVIRTVGIAKVEPNKLEDPFELQIYIPNASEVTDKILYEVD